MVKKADGGPAFPRSETDDSYGQDGMSLRDWLAGKAMAAYVARDVGNHTDRALWSYSQADAMLAARSA